MSIAIAVGIVVTFLAELLFVARFIFLPWWETAEGRMIMAKDVVLLAVLGLAVLGAFWPDVTWRTDVRATVWLLVPIVFVWKTALFYVRQAQGRRARKDTRHETQI